MEGGNCRIIVSTLGHQDFRIKKFLLKLEAQSNTGFIEILLNF
ncbi:hypothetical protein [Amphibacillus xylanus]|nr:hypothetical protein [Amphibacillus xylanus]